MKRLAFGLAALFAYAAGVQYNDPDPIRWFAIYGGAAMLSALTPFLRPPSPVFLGIAASAFAWALLILPGVVEAAAFTGTEEERELAGLVLVGSGMLALRAASRRGAAAEAG